MTILEKFGKKVRQLREEKGLSQEELAFKSELSVSTLVELREEKRILL